MIRVLAVGPHDAPVVLRMMKGTIARLFAKNSAGIDPRQLFADIEQNRCGLWVISEDKTPKAVAFTRVEEWIEGRVLRIMAVAGDDMGAWLKDFTEAMKSYGRGEGCFKMVTEGRAGWSKALGIKPVRQVYEMKTGLET